MEGKRNVVIWGAGRIGRGFIGDLFNDAGYAITYIDQAQALVDGLSKNQSYRVVRSTGENEIVPVDISDYQILYVTQKEKIQKAINQVDLIAIAVYPQNFEEVATQLQSHLIHRRTIRENVPLDILICTNLIHAGPKFEKFLLAGLADDQLEFFEKQIGIVETLVIRICPNPPDDVVADHPFVVWTNGYDILPVDTNGFKGELPEMSTLRFVKDMRAEEIRKIYTYNMCHAVLSFHGHMVGHTLLVDCLADDRIRREAQGALDEVSRALQTAYGFSAEEMKVWIDGIIEQTNNPTVGDTVVRSAADPLRKLKHEDRLIGPIMLCLKHDIFPKHLIKATAAALYYCEEGDQASQQLAERIQKNGVRETLIEASSLMDADHELVDAILEAYKQLPVEVNWAKKALRAGQLGFEYEEKYHGCGQSVIAAVSETLGVFDEELFNSATGLCGGIGLSGDATCSAFIGGAMMIGVFFPRRRENFDGDRENKYINFDLVQKLRQKFIDAYGTITCGQIHAEKYGRAFDLRDKNERHAFEDAGGHGQDGCTQVVAKASQWTVEVLAEAIMLQKED